MLGSQDATFRYLIESFPRLLLLSLDPHMTPVVEYLENIGVRRECMRNIFLLFPPVIFCNIKALETRMLAFKEVQSIYLCSLFICNVCVQNICNVCDF